MVSATVPSSPRRMRTPSPDAATVKPYWVETCRHAIIAPMISHHTRDPAAANRPAGDTAATTSPAATTTTATAAVEIAADPTSRPTGTEVTICSAGSGVAGSSP